MQVKVTVVDRTKLRRAPAIVQAETRRFVQEAAQLTKSSIQTFTPVVTGRAQRGWAVQVRGMSAEIENRVPYVPGLDRGYWIRRGRRVNRRKGPARMVEQGQQAALPKINALLAQTGNRIVAGLV